MVPSGRSGIKQRGWLHAMSSHGSLDVDKDVVRLGLRTVYMYA